MIADQWCVTSWRARPGSFVSLMTLYESNFVRLGWIAPDLQRLADQSVSRAAADCDLHLRVLERSRYTSVLRLTYEFEQAGGIVQDPNLEVCVYHDARLAEVRSFCGFVRHSHMSRLQMQVKRELDQRWSQNMMLNKWLEYCAERGHRF
jgi:uncharacterized protein YqiB (DUF1249 family)